MATIVFRPIKPTLRVAHTTLNRVIAKKRPLLLTAGDPVRVVRLMPAILTLCPTLYPTPCPVRIEEKRPPPKRRATLPKAKPTISSPPKRVRFEPAGVVELQLIKPTLRVKSTRPPPNPKQHKHAMNKQMRDIVAGAASHDVEAAKRVRPPSSKSKAKPKPVVDEFDAILDALPYPMEDPDKPVDENDDSRIQVIRATNAAYASASRFLMGRLNATIVELEGIKESRYDYPRQAILDAHARMRWNAEREIYHEENEIQRHISHLIVQIMTPNELPSKSVGGWLEEACFTLKVEVSTAIITHKPPSDEVINSVAGKESPLELFSGDQREAAPANAVDFASRASDILSERIDALMACMHDLHRFSASIAPHLITPVFSHHVVFSL
jgi:hypothetical protein